MLMWLSNGPHIASHVRPISSLHQFVIIAAAENHGSSSTLPLDMYIL